MAAHFEQLATAAEGDSNVLVSNWDGSLPLLPLVEEILDRGLNAEQLELVHWFIGYEYLPK